MQLSELFPLVCCTNMDYRPDRWAYAQQELSKLGLIPTRIPGVIYTNTSSTVLNGQIGCGLAHLNGLKLAKEENTNVLMFEDDVKFINDYPNIIQGALAELPDCWDMLYLGGNICRSIFQISSHLGKLTHAQSTHAYGVNKDFIDIILNTEDRILQRPIDLIYADELIPGNNCFILIPMVAIQRTDHSDIEGRKVDYSSWMEKRFYEQLIRK